MTHERIRLGISACLLGEPVRFDGGHKRDPFLVESLGQFVDWVPVCPEVESGLDAPRESMRLVQADGRIRLLTNKTAQDHTTRMRGYARRRVEELADGELFGFVLKKDSPTCGLERVKVYGTAGMPVKSGRGLFADALVTRFPLLPVEEEGRLNDPRLRENFVERIFAYRRLTALFAVTVVDGRRRAVPHRAQAHADGPPAGGLSAPRPPGGIGQGDGAARIPGSLFDRIHDGARDHRHAAPAGERAAAHARLLQADARPREPGRAARPHRGLCRSGACRWSCRSRSSSITSAGAVCRIWRTRSICGRIRSS